MNERSPIAWISSQLLFSREQAAAQAPRPRNPSPLLGKWRSGSATEQVFEWLSHQGRTRVWWSRDAIVAGTGRTGKAVDWALLFLRSIRAVELTTDPRCGRYHRYRASQGATVSAFRRRGG